MSVRRLGAIAVNCMLYPEIGTKSRSDGQVPAVLGGIGGDALEQAVVIPAEREQDITWAFHVGTGKGQLTELGGVTKNGTDRLPSRSAGT